MTTRSTLTGWLLCAPALSVLAVFLLGPALVALGLSFTDWNGLSDSVSLVGLDNYADLAASEAFWDSLWINLIVAAVTVALQMGLGLLLASALASRRRSSTVYRSLIFAPQVLSIAAVGLIWSLVYDPYDGLANRVLTGVTGLDPQPWLGDPVTALPAVMLTATWFYFGFHMVLYLAGMSAIPRDYYDAVALETESRWHAFRYITLPLLREVLLVSFTIIVSGAFGHLIGLFSLMTNGGPAGSTEILGLLMTHLAFRGAQYGLASALAVVMVVLVLVLIAVPTWRIARERLEY